MEYPTLDYYQATEVRNYRGTIKKKIHTQPKVFYSAYALHVFFFFPLIYCSGFASCDGAWNQWDHSKFSRKIKEFCKNRSFLILRQYSDYRS